MKQLRLIKGLHKSVISLAPPGVLFKSRKPGSSLGGLASISEVLSLWKYPARTKTMPHRPTPNKQIPSALALPSADRNETRAKSGFLLICANRDAAAKVRQACRSLGQVDKSCFGTCEPLGIKNACLPPSRDPFARDQFHNGSRRG